MKFLNPKVHGYLDYAVVVTLLIAPSLFGFTDNAATVSYILGIFYIPFSLLTAYPLSLAKIIPFTWHGALELVASPLLVAMPWIAGFSGHDPSRNFFIVAGVALFFVWLVTDYKAADIAYGKRSMGFKPGKPRPA